VRVHPCTPSSYITGWNTDLTHSNLAELFTIRKNGQNFSILAANKRAKLTFWTSCGNKLTRLFMLELRGQFSGSAYFVLKHKQDSPHKKIRQYCTKVITNVGCEVNTCGLLKSIFHVTYFLMGSRRQEHSCVPSIAVKTFMEIFTFSET